MSKPKLPEKAYVVVMVHDSGTVTVRDVYLSLDAATRNAALIGGHVSTVPLVTEKADWPSTVKVQQRTCRVCGDVMRCKSHCHHYCSGPERHSMMDNGSQGDTCAECGAPGNNP